MFHLDRPMYLLGYLAAQSKVYLIDKVSIPSSFRILLEIMSDKAPPGLTLSCRVWVLSCHQGQLLTGPVLTADSLHAHCVHFASCPGLE